MIVETKAGSATFFGAPPENVVDDMPLYLRLLFRAATLHDFAVEFLVPNGESAPRVSDKRFVLICDEDPSPVPNVGPLGYSTATLIPDLRAAHSVVIVGGAPTVEAYAMACLPLVKGLAGVAILIETDGALVDVWLATAAAARGSQDGIVVFLDDVSPLSLAAS